MSYAQRKEISGNRTLAIIIVVVIQFALGYAIVTGLAYNVIKKAAEDLKTFDVEEQPPPPEEPPPPPKDMPKVPPPPMTAAAAGADERAAAADRDAGAPPPQIPPVVAPPPPAAAAAAQGASRAAPRATFASLFSADDYPASRSGRGRRGHGAGAAHHRADGRVVGCNLIRSTGNGSLEFGDLQHPAPPREVHAGARQQRQSDDRHVTTPPIVWRLEG